MTRHLLSILLAAGLVSLPRTTRSQAHVRSSSEETPRNEVSLLLETSGKVEWRPNVESAWVGARIGMPLPPGCHVRTGPGSRAAVRLGDRSVLRLNERTTLEIQPPRTVEKHRFRLWEGILFFLNRERPSDVEFETPITTGAIRGTEFVLDADPADGATHLALIEGKVRLSGESDRVELEAGEVVELRPGQAPGVSPLIHAGTLIQWALYYPAILHPPDLPWVIGEREALREALAAYDRGDLLQAREAASRAPEGSEASALFRAGLDLTVGRVDLAELRLRALAAPSDARGALEELIRTVRTGAIPVDSFSDAAPSTATRHLVQSYVSQAGYHLTEALHHAEQAAALAPGFGFAHARVAELLLALDRRREARSSLARAMALSPRLAQAHVLRGFGHLDSREPHLALAEFREALESDPALGSAWVGRGLAEMRLGRRIEARRSLQTAALLDPRQSLHRSYLGKAFADAGEPALAEKELRRARALDPTDPTPWFYSGLVAWMHHRPNLAVRDLQRSVDLNDHRQMFRSRLGLDQDLSIRQASLAAVYRDAGLPEVALRSASRAVSEDPAGFTGHLFLARSYQALEDPARFDLRYETVRLSELLVANLLAPPGGANLSQLTSQQERLQYFDQRQLGLTTWTEVRSSGDWHQEATAFGTLGKLDYAFDGAFRRLDGPATSDEYQRGDLSLQLKQHLSIQDDAYLQVAVSEGSADDIARRADPNARTFGFRVHEFQVPLVLAGWHRAWTPAHHTLLLAGKTTDRLELFDPDPDILFLRQIGGQTASVSTPPLFARSLESHSDLLLAEIQHLWTGETHALVGGFRGQVGAIESTSRLDRPLTATVTRERVDESLDRIATYLYDRWRLTRTLHLVAGVSYDRLNHPVNVDTSPLTRGNVTRELVAPKAAMLWSPDNRSLLRVAYSRSLGGQYFDQSLRLEPAQLAGFPQTFRSLVPESVAGLTPGSKFDALNASVDHRFGSSFHSGMEIGVLRSTGDRQIGVLRNTLALPVPDTPGSARQDLRFEELQLSAYAVSTFGEGGSIGLRHRITDSRLESRFPSIPRGTPGLSDLEQDGAARLHETSLTASFTHSSGFLAQWESLWLHQDVRGDRPGSWGGDTVQHNLWLGYRWPRRGAELRLGLLNLTDADYRLDPLNPWSRLPRERTAAVSLRLNF